MQRLALEAHVELPGPMPQEEVARALRACHVFVMPCRRDRTGDMDGIPTVFMEALATGAAGGELRRLGRARSWCATARRASSCRRTTAAALADAVERLAADPALRARLGCSGRALVEQQHDQDRNARRVVELLAGGSDGETGTLRPGVLTALDGRPPAR